MDRPSSEGDSPAGQVPPPVSLQRHGRSANLAVPDPLQPPPDRLLDGDAGGAEFVGPQLLQVSHLAGPEEDLRLPKLEHVWFLPTQRNVDADLPGCRAAAHARFLLTLISVSSRFLQTSFLSAAVMSDLFIRTRYRLKNSRYVHLNTRAHAYMQSHMTTTGD